MNGAAMENSAWPGSRWAWLFVLLAGAQVFLIWEYSEQAQPPRERIARPAVSSLVFNAQSNAASIAWLALGDPTIFSLANPNNFSGRAWLNGQSMAHPWKDWVETEGGQALNPADLGQAFEHGFENRPEMSEVAVEKPEAALTILAINDGPITTQSVMRIEGDLASLKLEKAADLPGWTNAETLAPTTVEMGVGSDGLPLSVRLVERCGLSAADQFAVNAARGLRFAAQSMNLAPNPALIWGRAVFQWQTLMVAATNGTAANH
jgi:hypothetical protein